MPAEPFPRKAIPKSEGDHFHHVSLSLCKLSAAHRTENSPFRLVSIRETKTTRRLMRFVGPVEMEQRFSVWLQSA
jgi:hypothetical protein